jgi:predicted transposase/invertase (TIGR01784 family)
VALLLHLLNAILAATRRRPIVELELLNPFNDKEALDDKPSIVDVKARDEGGRQFNVEMQMLAPWFFPGRALYYWAKLHQQQMKEGDDYRDLRPTISVCFLNSVLFPGLRGHHHVFRLWDDRHKVSFRDDVEAHVLELPRFTRTARQLRSPLDVRCYFLCHAETLEPANLAAALQIPLIQQAVEVLTVLTQDELERERYEARLKAQRDHASFTNYAQDLAKRELEKGLQQGLEKGRKEGLEKGRKEGLQKGELVGRVHAYRDLLQQPLTPAEELLALPLDQLARLTEDLKRQARPRRPRAYVRRPARPGPRAPAAERWCDPPNGPAGARPPGCSAKPALTGR